MLKVCKIKSTYFCNDINETKKTVNPLTFNLTNL